MTTTMTDGTQPSLAEAMKTYRSANKLSRQKLAEAAGLTGAKIANLEKGRAPKAGEWESLAPLLTGAQVLQPVLEPPSQGGEGAVAAAGVSPLPVAVAPPPAAAIAPEIDFVSNSELQCFKRCRRKWWLAFYRRIGLKERQVTGARSIGTRVHQALAVWYRVEKLNPYEVLNASVAEDLELFPDQAHEIMQEAELCKAMIEGYFQWLAETGADEGLEIIGDEQNIEASIDVNGVTVRIGGRLDVRARRTLDNAVLFLDHKTVGNLSEPVRTLHMDEQMLMYHLLEYLNAVAQGVEAPHTDGGLYNMLRKVKRTAQAKPPFFDRIEVRHNINELRSFYLRVHGEISQIMALRQQLDAGADPRWAAYPTPRRDCTWDCDFLPVCPMFDDGSNVEGLVAQLYEQVNPYQRYVNDKVETT